MRTASRSACLATGGGRLHLPTARCARSFQTGARSCASPTATSRRHSPAVHRPCDVLRGARLSFQGYQGPEHSGVPRLVHREADAKVRSWHRGSRRTCTEGSL